MTASPGPKVGERIRLRHDDWTAEVTTTGAALALVRHAGHDLLDGFGTGQSSTAARGQILAPWTNRLRDGRYSFGSSVHELAITDPGTETALHGLVAEVSWEVTTSDRGSVTLEHRLPATDGYPWSLSIGVTYALSVQGLAVTHTVRNLSWSEAPYAVGAHPYLVVGAGPVDDWTIELDAAQVMLVDDARMLPTDIVDVGAVGLDFRLPRQVGVARLNHAFTGLGLDALGRSVVTISAGDRRIALWGGEGCRWMQLYTGDFDPLAPRRSLAVEPMSAPADAFNSGRDLVVLSPAGRPGSTHRMEWGIGV